MARRTSIALFVLFLLLSLGSAGHAAGPGGDSLRSSVFPKLSASHRSWHAEEHWSIPVGEGARALAADLDHDGRLEVVLTDGRTLTVLDARGKVRLQKEYPGDVAIELVEDLEGSPTPELLVRHRVGTAWEGRVLDVAGNELRRFSYEEAHDTSVRFVGPFEASGQTRLLALVSSGFSTATRGLVAFDYVSGGIAWIFDMGPAPLTLPPITDVDRDGEVDFLLGGCTWHNGKSGEGDGDKPPTTDHEIVALLVNASGKEVDRIPYDDHVEGCLAVAAADLDNRGAQEILLLESHGVEDYSGASAIHAFDGDTYRPRASFTGPNNAGWQGWAVADLDGDGTREVVVGSEDGRVRVLDSDLNLLREAGGHGALLGVADFDGRLPYEIVAADPTSSRVFVLDASLAPRAIIKAPHIRSPERDVAAQWTLAADLDGDGANELLLLGSRLVVVGFPAYGAGDVARLTWAWAVTHHESVLSIGMTLGTPAVLWALGRRRKRIEILGHIVSWRNTDEGTPGELPALVLATLAARIEPSLGRLPRRMRATARRFVQGTAADRSRIWPELSEGARRALEDRWAVRLATATVTVANVLLRRRPP